jgi:hypothetical protein
MAMTYKRNVARFADTVGVEEAEAFLAWLHEASQAEARSLGLHPYSCGPAAGVDGGAASHRKVAARCGTHGLAEIGPKLDHEDK